jgi:hypothetical protein
MSMRRLFWLALGATVGILLVRRFTRAAEAYTPEGISRSLGSVAESLRDMAEVVREGMAEREQELRVALGVDAGTMDPKSTQHLLDNPTSPQRDR